MYQDCSLHMALANVNNTKRSAVDQLYTAFRSVVEGERAIILFSRGAGKPSITLGCATTSFIDDGCRSRPKVIAF